MDEHWLAHVLSTMWIRREKSDFEISVLSLRLEAMGYTSTVHDKEPIAFLYLTLNGERYCTIGWL